jgi:hypothetical protein
MAVLVAAMFLRADLSFFLLCVTPGSQEHDSPYGIFRSGAGGGGGAAFTGRPWCRRGGGAAGPPQFVTEGLFDLVRPGAFPCSRQLRRFHGLCLAQMKRYRYRLSLNWGKDVVAEKW